MDVLEVRMDFPIVDEKVFLNHAGISPCPRQVKEAMEAHLCAWATMDLKLDEMEEARRVFATLIDAKPDEVALMPNTSMGINTAAHAIDYPKSCNVVTTDLEFPSVVYPFLSLKRSRGVELRVVKNIGGRIALEDVEQAADDRTALIAISHVEYGNGFRNDLKELSKVAHEHGAYILVDAIQSLGALKVDVKRLDVDFLACGGYKWLMAPLGTGFLYVREELVEKLEPSYPGWASATPEAIRSFENRSLELAKTATRFETGTGSLIGFIGAHAAVNLILRRSVEAIEERVLALTGYLIEKLREIGAVVQSPLEPESRSGIVNFKVGDPEALVKRLQAKGFIVSARAGGIRVSPHYYNLEEEVDRFTLEVGEAIL